MAHTRSKKNRIIILNNIKTEVNFKRHIPSLLGAGSKPRVWEPAEALAQDLQPRNPTDNFREAAPKTEVLEPPHR
jgi:hypothetical protein